MIFAFKHNHVLAKLALNASRLESAVLQPATGAGCASTVQLTDCSFSTSCYDSTAIAQCTDDCLRNPFNLIRLLLLALIT